MFPGNSHTAPRVGTGEDRVEVGRQDARETRKRTRREKDIACTVMCPRGIASRGLRRARNDERSVETRVRGRGAAKREERNCLRERRWKSLLPLRRRTAPTSGSRVRRKSQVRRSQLSPPPSLAEYPRQRAPRFRRKEGKCKTPPRSRPYPFIREWKPI